MPRKSLAVNPQPEILQNRSNIFKNTQSIGRIYSKKSLSALRDSSDSVSFNLNNNSRMAFRQEILLGAQSPLERVNRLQVQFGGKFSRQVNNEKSDNDKSMLEINPVTNKSFRINKLYSSDMSNFAQRKKTPELIGKFSSSNITKAVGLIQSKANHIKGNKKRSPGHLTQRKPYKRGAKQQLIPLINSPEISRFMQFMDQNLITSQQLSQTQLNPQNQLLLQQVKHKQQYLKQIIQKRKKAGSQQPIPPKIIQEFKYNYPVSKNTQRHSNKSSNKTSPYLQKIQKNSRLFEGTLMSPRFLNKVKEAATNSRMGNERGKTSRFHDHEEVLERSRNKDMKISPQINVSFTIKSPRKKQEEDAKGILERQALNDVQEWRENLSRVSLYSPEKNINFNNRRPKFVSMLIDPSKQELQMSSQTEKPTIDLHSLAQHFSRSRISSLQIKNQQQPHFITLKTPLSSLKQLLIESGPTSNVHLHLPSCLFDTTKMIPNIEIKDLHLFIEKVYNQMRIRPEIITIKRYQNAIFTGVFQSSTKNFNLFASIIYHFSGSVYVGGWKESRSPFDMHKLQVDGCKHGMGLQILCHQYSQKIEENQKTSNIEEIQRNSPSPLKLDIYYGQFKQNNRRGYGIRFKTDFLQSKLIQETTEIGCWTQGQKNGWVKTYKNSQLISNAEYQKDQKLKSLALRDQTQLFKLTP